MRYSKSLDLVISALVYARNGNVNKAAALFDKAVTSSDAIPTIARLEKVQAAAFNADFGKTKTTAQLMREIAAKKAKAKAKPKAPIKGKKKAKAKMRKEKAFSDDMNVGDDFDQITDDMTVSNGLADDDTVLNGNPGGVSFAEEDEDMDEDDMLEDMDDVSELPEAAVDEKSDLEPLNDLEVADLDDIEGDDTDLDMDFSADEADDGVVDEFESLPDDDAFDATADTDGDDDEDDEEDDDEDEAEAKVIATTRQERRLQQAAVVARRFKLQAKKKTEAKAVAAAVASKKQVAAKSQSPSKKEVSSNAMLRMKRVQANLKAFASLQKK